MRAPLLLPLLPLLLHGVSSQDNGATTGTTTASPGESKQITTTTVTTVTTQKQETSPASKPGSPSSTTGMSPTTTQQTPSTSKPSNLPPVSVLSASPTTTKGTTPASTSGNMSPTLTSAHTTAQTTKPRDNSDNLTPAPAMSTSATPQVSSSASSRSSAATSAATSSATQEKISPPASLTAKPAATSSPAQASTPSATAEGSAPAATPCTSVAGRESCPSVHPTSTAASPGVPASGLLPTGKNHSVSSPTSVTKQPHTSPTSPVQKLATTPKPGSTGTSVTLPAGSTSSMSSKTSPSSPSGSIDKALHTITTTTPKTDPDYTSQGDRSVSHKPGIPAQSPTSAQPSAPAPGNQTTISRPGQQHPNGSVKNEVICKDQIEETWPIINLKEARTCNDWRTHSANDSFFEIFCSVRRHVFDSKKDKCTVTLASSDSQRWAVHAVVHHLLDAEAVFEELKGKTNELEKFGITNVTFLSQEMEEDIKDQLSTPLIITIVTLAGSLLLIAAIYGCCHQRFSQKKSQHIHPDLPGFDDGRAILIFNQRLTEELQTMENGYHDNPTLEVMETCSEMQEKKVNLNGELGDSWIVPLDTIMKEDLEEEEDTHL